MGEFLLAGFELVCLSGFIAGIGVLAIAFGA